jgi:uncharacterized protein YabE (DUF348 family)
MRESLRIEKESDRERTRERSGKRSSDQVLKKGTKTKTKRTRNGKYYSDLITGGSIN